VPFGDYFLGEERRFDFGEVALVKEVAEAAKEFAALLEDRPGCGR
jgi:hypothetical protein